MTKKTTLSYKNILLLLAMPILSHCKTVVQYMAIDDMPRVDWYVLINFTRRIDFAMMYYANFINFVIISFCLLFPKGIHREIKLYILVIAVMDLIHEILLSSQGFEVFKVVIAALITTTVILYRKNA